LGLTNFVRLSEKKQSPFHPPAGRATPVETEKKLTRKPGKDTAKRAPENLAFLKGTAFRPFVAEAKTGAAPTALGIIVGI
jgi:hypothetical protein